MRLSSWILPVVFAYSALFTAVVVGGEVKDAAKAEAIFAPEKRSLLPLNNLHRDIVLATSRWQLPFRGWVDAVGHNISPQSEKPLDQFWEEVERRKDQLIQFTKDQVEAVKKEYTDVADRIDELRESVEHIVSRSGELQREVVGTLAKRDGATDISLETISAEFEHACHAVLEELQHQFPPADQALGHEERHELALRLMNAVEERFVAIGLQHGIEEQHFRDFFNAIREAVVKVVVTAGDVVEQHPVLVSVVISGVVGFFLPETWILRPLLSLFGFGPLGPVKGSWAAFIQSRLYGAVVPAKSWFSFLQRQGMVAVGKNWWGAVIGVIGGIFGGAKAVSLCGGGRK